MNYSEKASKFLELSEIDNPNVIQNRQLSELRDQLAALGLEPQHRKGLTYRALVYDNRKMIARFLNLKEAKKDTKGLGRRLKSLGIDINQTYELRHMLAEFKKKAKEVERQKDIRHVNFDRQIFEAECDRLMAAGDDDDEDEEETADSAAGQLAFGTV